MVKIHKRPQKKGRKQETVIARIDERLKNKVQKALVDDKTTMTDLIEDCLIRYLDEKKKGVTVKDNMLK